MGIRSAVGGSPEALAQENQTRKKRWRRFRLAQSGLGLISDDAGTVFISHHIESAALLPARYSEATNWRRQVSGSRLPKTGYFKCGLETIGDFAPKLFKF